MKLPSDKVLMDDPEFYRYVELYAKDEEAFFRDYALSHKKLSELGFIGRSKIFEIARTVKILLKQDIVKVVAFAGAVLVLGFYYDVNKGLHE